MTIEHKIVENAPDAFCKVCSQLYDGECRAYEVPHSEEERLQRVTKFGMECDSLPTKEIRHRRYGVMYKIPAGKFDKEDPIEGN